MSVNMHVYEWHKHAYRPDNAGGDKDICKSCKNLCAPGGIVKCIISTLQSVLNQHMRVGRIVVISGFPVFVVIMIKTRDEAIFMNTKDSDDTYSIFESIHS